MNRVGGVGWTQVLVSQYLLDSEEVCLLLNREINQSYVGQNYTHH